MSEEQKLKMWALERALELVAINDSAFTKCTHDTVLHIANVFKAYIEGK